MPARITMVPVHVLVLAGGATAIGAHPMLAIALPASLSLNVAVAVGVLKARNSAMARRGDLGTTICFREQA